jgi:lipopolysaccharide transport system permease protein
MNDHVGESRVASVNGVAPVARVWSVAPLLQALVVREFRGRYRRSLLGPAWAVLQPLLYMGIFVFVRRALDAPSPAGVPYPLFAFAALVPWMLFSSAVTRCTVCIYANQNVVKKMPVPREVFPVAAVAVALLDFLLAFAVLLAMMVGYGVVVGPALLWLPVLTALVAVFALALGFGAAALGAYKNDMALGVPYLLQLWLLATPILYRLEDLPERARSLYLLNPMVGYTEAFRSVLLHDQSPDPATLGVAVGVTGILLLVTWPVFRGMSRYFADVL